jgi:glycerophosphoryl diester phosphodiesterase
MSDFRNHIIAPLVSALLMLCACDSDLRVMVPDTTLLDERAGTRPLSRPSGACIEGVYVVREGSHRLGDTVIVKSTPRSLSVFCAKNSLYAVLDCGMSDSSLIATGYWRNAHSPQTGLCVLRMSADEGGRSVVNQQRPVSMTLRGVLGSATDMTGDSIVLSYCRPVHSDAKGFSILAHRGGGRNSDRLPHSENSVELIRMAEKFGATGVEIDVRLTKDGVPVLYHDENFNTRLVDGEYMVGPIGNYTYAQIQTFCRLVNGERLPTLAETLRAVVDSTQLRTVWLDVKDAASVERVVALQQEAMERARELAARGLRDTLEVLFGLAGDDVYARFTSQPGYTSIPSVCELGPEQTRTAASRVYGSRWTLGTIDDAVKTLHAEGRRAFVWTLDADEFITRFLREGSFDGILTNYPTLVAYYYYLQQ